MKQKLLLKTMLLLCALIAGMSSAWATDKTVSWAATAANDFGSAISTVNNSNTGTISTGSFSWDYTNTLTYLKNNKSDYQAFSNGFIQIGSGNAYHSLTLSTSEIPGTIKSVSVECSSASAKHKLTVTVGSTKYIDAQATASGAPTTTDDYTQTGTGTSSGTITISFTPGSGALYIKSISVTYEEASGSTPSITANDVPIAFNATSGSIAYTLANGTGNVEAEITGGNDGAWLELGTITSSAVPFTCSANTGATARTAEVTLSFTGADDKVVTVTQAGNPASPACTIDLDYYDFGNVAVNGTATKTFTVTTANLTGNVTLSMDGDAGFSVSPTTIAQNATSTEVTVTFTPTSAGVSAAQLKANGSGFVNRGLAEIEGTGAQSYNVTFNPGNGTCATASTTELEGTEIDLPTATPSVVCQEAGWTFAGWATASVATSSTATLLTGKYTVTENITLYAVYQLTNANGASTTFDFGDIASANSWSDATAYTPVTISPITISTQSGGNNAKYYKTDKTWRMYNGGTMSITSAAGAITSVTSNPSTTFTISNGSASQSFTETTKFKSITVNYATATFASSPVAIVAKPEISGTTPFYGTTEVTITCGTAGATIQYSTDDGANWNTYTAPFNINSTTTVKAKATKTNWEDSEVVEKTFTAIAPLTVTEALTAINALDNNGQITEQYVKGYVSTTGSLSSGKITYSISVDGNATNELKIYKGKGLNDANFAAATDIALGDEVVVYGTLQKYYANSTTTPEFIEGNYLFNKVRHPAPTFTLDPTSKSLDAYSHETVDVTLTTNTDGAITCESSDEDVATVALKSAGVYTITAQTAGTATITIKSAVSENYAPASATVAITVTDERADAGISFAKDAEETTWGESYTVQELTNTNNVEVVWSSTDQEVAIINGDGTGLNLNKAGTTTIKATFAGNATYKATVASYTLTIKKANADLSYDETSFDIMLNDDNFVAPTLNNPHNQVVTYASSNTAIATVNANTGAIETLVTTAEGSATITATLEANIWYNGGTASYTINVIDPDKKGGKFNPYTVAEVIDGTATGSGIYFTGYIVGNYNSSAPVNPATGDTNLALADASNETTGSNTIPVELPNNSIRTNWGPQSNNVVGYKVLLKGNAQQYFSTNGIKGTSEISAVSIPITPAKKYTTLTSKYALDFTGLGLEAYIVEDNDLSDNAVTLTQVNKVPANTGLVLKASIPGTAVNVPVFNGTGADDVTGNLMKGSATTTTTVAENAGYILKDGVFQPSSGANALPAGKAYLNLAVPTNNAPALKLDFGGATGINTVQSSEFMVKGSDIYNLKGQKVSQPSKGLYIVSGRKVVIK